MSRNKIAIFVGSLTVAGMAYWLLAPLFVDRKVDEKIEDIIVEKRVENQEKSSPQSLETISAGTFVGLANHEAQGSVKLVRAGEKYFVRFEDDFKSTNGPDVFVHLGKNGQYDSNAVLGPIKGNIGGQNYEIPATLDMSMYDEVWLWCRAFSVPFGKSVMKEGA